jgi:hypothetical protein
MAGDAGKTTDESLAFGSQAEAAAWWGCSLRTYQRWVKMGAPMDRPAAVPGWWARHCAETHGQRRRDPSWVAKALGQWRQEQSPEMEDGGAAEEIVEAEARRSASLDPAEQAGVEMNFEEQVRRQRVIVNAHYLRLVEEYKAGKDITVHERRYQAALEQLRKMEKDAAKLKIEAGRAWDRDEVRAVVKDMVNALNGGLDYLHARLEKRLGLNGGQVQAVKEVSGELKQIWRENKLGLEVASDPQ